jgi:hypothetical protein
MLFSLRTAGHGGESWEWVWGRDPAKKVQRSAIHADTAAVATATQVSDSSDRAPNVDPPSDASLRAHPPGQYWSGAGWSWPGLGSGAPALRAS